MKVAVVKEHVVERTYLVEIPYGTADEDIYDAVVEIWYCDDPFGRVRQVGEEVEDPEETRMLSIHKLGNGDSVEPPVWECD
jgi:hypothetical protein